MKSLLLLSILLAPAVGWAGIYETNYDTGTFDKIESTSTLILETSEYIWKQTSGMLGRPWEIKLDRDPFYILERTTETMTINIWETFTKFKKHHYPIEKTECFEWGDCNRPVIDIKTGQPISLSIACTSPCTKERVYMKDGRVLWRKTKEGGE